MAGVFVVDQVLGERKRRMALLSLWVKLPAWLLILSGLINLLIYSTAIFFGYPTKVSIFGWSAETAGTALGSFLVTLLWCCYAISAYTVVRGRTLGRLTGLIFGYSYLIIGIGGLGFNPEPKLDLLYILMIMYIYKLHELKTRW